MGRRVLTTILLLLTSLSSLYAQREGSIIAPPKAEYSECLIHFRANQSLVESGYMSNAKELLRLKDTFSRILTDAKISVDSIMIYVSSSPEGNFYTNRWLMRVRVQSLCDYLYGEYPTLKDENVIVTSDPENWSGLKQLLADDPKVPKKSEVLNIIDTASSPYLKKHTIKELDKSVTYSYITSNFSRRLRCGSIKIFWHNSENDMIKPSVIENIENIETLDSMVRDSNVYIYPPNDLKAQDFSKIDTTITATTAPKTTTAADTTDTTGTKIGTTDLSDIEPLVPQYITPRNLSTYGDSPKFALKTNLLYLAALCLNIEGELYFAERWSVNLDYQYAWWSNKTQHKYYRLAAVSPELRYWFASKGNFRGHFAGVYIGAGLYEFMAKPSSGIQGEFFIAGGVTYGWACPVSRWMNMEFSIGIGYMMSEYRAYYHDVDCYVYTSTQRLKYFGPTKAKVSLVFPLHLKKVKR